MSAKHICRPCALPYVSRRSRCIISEKDLGELKVVKSIGGLEITLLDITETGRTYTAETVSESADEYRITFKDYPHDGEKGLSLLIPKNGDVFLYHLGLSDSRNPRRKGRFRLLNKQGCRLGDLLKNPK